MHQNETQIPTVPADCCPDTSVGEAQETGKSTVMKWTERTSHTADVPRWCFITQQGALTWHGLCERCAAGKLRLCWLESKGSQAASAVCLQAPVMWQVLLIDDQGILDFFAENVAGRLICLLCIEKTLGLVTGQQAMRCQTRTLRLDPHPAELRRSGSSPVLAGDTERQVGQELRSRAAQQQAFIILGYVKT